MSLKLASIIFAVTVLLFLSLGWHSDTFLYRAFGPLLERNIAIDEGIKGLSSYSEPARIVWRGDIQNNELRESSGLAYSTRQKGVLWSINDSFSDAEVFALSEIGKDLGKWRINDVDPRDWEGMDSFRLNGRNYLLIADTGDNLLLRKTVSFLVFEEPYLDSSAEDIDVSWQTNFEFPDGPKDVEAVAVDTIKSRVLFLNKRELPLRLYSVPLLPSAGKIIAENQADLVPVPRYRSSLESLYGRTAKYLGLPTGMDLFEDRLLITTYRNAYLYDYDALDKPPREIVLPFSGQREAITFGFESGEFAYVSREREKGTQVADIFEIRFSHQSN